MGSDAEPIELLPLLEVVWLPLPALLVEFPPVRRLVAVVLVAEPWVRPLPRRLDSLKLSSSKSAPSASRRTLSPWCELMSSKEMRSSAKAKFI